MPNFDKYPRWNPLYKDPSHLAGAYLNRMSVVDPIPSRIRLELRNDIGDGHLPGMPFNVTWTLETRKDGSHSYLPVYIGNFPPGILSTVEFLWAVSDEGFEPLTYAGILHVVNFGVIHFAGSIREWPQEGVENPVRKPWRQPWTFSIQNLLLPDFVSIYDVIPIPFQCWPAGES